MRNCRPTRRAAIRPDLMSCSMRDSLQPNIRAHADGVRSSKRVFRCTSICRVSTAVRGFTGPVAGFRTLKGTNRARLVGLLSAVSENRRILAMPTPQSKAYCQEHILLSTSDVKSLTSGFLEIEIQFGTGPRGRTTLPLPGLSAWVVAVSVRYSTSVTSNQYNDSLTATPK